LPKDLFKGGTNPPATTTTTTSGKATTTTTTTVSAAPKAKLIGDANLDDNVTVADAVAILQFIGNKDKYKLSDEAKANADCCDPGDGITGSDALAIQKLDAKLITELPELSK
ncbi:MAG: beta-mannosidase, partial [Ruminococcus sp.]|nr:beta-mannosidase [Ruminococcus sp.]